MLYTVWLDSKLEFSHMGFGQLNKTAMQQTSQGHKKFFH